MYIILFVQWKRTRVDDIFQACFFYPMYPATALPLEDRTEALYDLIAKIGKS